ncbi:MAG TPA: ribosomal L7Ae/L30e/S12e/Gadd45 family protein [Methylomusa anaerophila]|uniref:Putative ribosomal protein YlxQ n=1 Tax=Methylomusa anaerophila TaxID=1930071 RepID=A0A348APZ0_9FIRM|nr:ribosomal L7Ae/L30e/S12e/Gadd45 family protein [Methylomusa anaerophila]BBB93138.1 putative ribosomal protein YlxQ [Methylomusa anaerophila]HML87029.1 ribosomal L7Ae/L30e/S12e/Gadd45 family protein [Methylomusa anaerophila]
MNEQKLMSILGLAQKAGKLASGEFAVQGAIKSGKARLLLIASDASESTKQTYRDQAAYYKIASYEASSKDHLGRCIGKARRAAIAIIDDGFAKSIVSLL